MAGLDRLAVPIASGRHQQLRHQQVMCLAHGLQEAPLETACRCATRRVGVLLVPPTPLGFVGLEEAGVDRFRLLSIARAYALEPAFRREAVNLPRHWYKYVNETISAMYPTWESPGFRHIRRSTRAGLLTSPAQDSQGLPQWRPSSHQSISYPPYWVLMVSAPTRCRCARLSPAEDQRSSTGPPPSPVA